MCWLTFHFILKFLINFPCTTCGLQKSYRSYQCYSAVTLEENALERGQRRKITFVCLRSLTCLAGWAWPALIGRRGAASHAPAPGDAAAPPKLFAIIKKISHICAIDLKCFGAAANVHIMKIVQCAYWFNVMGTLGRVVSPNHLDILFNFMESSMGTSTTSGAN